MSTGTVRRFNATKGYGFIAPEDSLEDAFVHISAVGRAGLGTLHESLAEPEMEPRTEYRAGETAGLIMLPGGGIGVPAILSSVASKKRTMAETEGDKR